MIHRMDPPPDGSGAAARADRADEGDDSRSSPPTTSAGAYEIKWDGVRAIALCRTGQVDAAVAERCATSPRSTRRSRAIALELEGREAVLDGELVAFDEDGGPSFQRLQRRMHVASEAEVRKRRGDVPVTYVDLRPAAPRRASRCSSLPYEERRERLEALGLDGESWQTPAYHRGDGAAMLDGEQGAGPGGGGRQAARLAATGRAGAAAIGSRSRTSAARRW